MRPLEDLRGLHQVDMSLLPEGGWGWGRHVMVLVSAPPHARSPNDGGWQAEAESPELLCPRLETPGKGTTATIAAIRLPRGGCAGSETRPRVRHQPQVPREQAKEVEDDTGFVALRRVLEQGRRHSEAEAGISSRKTLLRPFPNPPLLRTEPLLTQARPRCPPA